MAELQNPDPLVEAVAKARKESSRRPDLKFPVGTLNEIDGHVYAYSGQRGTSTAGVADVIRFVTGVNALKGHWICQGAYVVANLGTGCTSVFRIQLDGVEIISPKVETAQEDSPTLQVIPFIIPPFTTVSVNILSDQTGATYLSSISFIGEVL